MRTKRLVVVTLLYLMFYAHIPLDELTLLYPMFYAYKTSRQTDGASSVQFSHGLRNS